ncbi:hypothetical protein QBC37DRAFT_389346 [Rhypophila decipiens]|uniref:Uncharacterized protein n=1 Tax=Rhypophila decipiens TaxID=261697 RepID=A0AAN6Y9C2_9PEZI|nr:hypothetical protein QBC37DRAFT_389346 [Rhypophila decipiens]
MENQNQSTPTGPASHASSSVTNTQNKETLDRMLSRFTAAIVRKPIENNIEEFQAALAEFFQKTAVFLHSSKIINIYGASTIMDDHTIVDAANRLIQSSEFIIYYLTFMGEKTGLPSGGDPPLESEVTAAREWAKILLNAFKALKKVERSAGGLQGLKPSYWVSVKDGKIMYHKRSGEWVDLTVEHPALRNPGTQWHKWFTGSNQAINDRCQFSNQFRPNFSVLFPSTANFVPQYLATHFRHFDAAFNHTNCKVIDEGLRLADVSALFAIAVDNWMDPEHNGFTSRPSFNPRQNSLSIRPQSTTSGQLPFEELNFTINQSAMDGTFIWANEYPQIRREVRITAYHYYSDCCDYDTNYDDNWRGSREWNEAQSLRGLQVYMSDSDADALVEQQEEEDLYGEDDDDDICDGEDMDAL